MHRQMSKVNSIKASYAAANILEGKHENHIDGLVQDCSNSSASALDLLQSCTKPSIYVIHQE